MTHHPLPTIAFGSDHGGYNLKQSLIQALRQRGHLIVDCGADSLESVDYPDYGHAVARCLKEGRADLGVLCCGTSTPCATRPCAS